MTLGDIATKARALTKTTNATDSYTSAQILIDVNLWFQKMVSMILESQDEVDFDDTRQTKYPTATRLLVAAQRDYAFGTASWTLLGKEGAAGTSAQTLLPLKVKRLDIAYDGVNYNRATPLSVGEIQWGLGNELALDQNYIKQAPAYGVQNNSVFVYPMAIASDVTSGAIMRIEQERNIIPFVAADYTSDITDSTVVPAIDAPFQMMMAYGAAHEFYLANNSPQLKNIQEELADWEARLRTAYGRKSLDREMQMNYAYDYRYGR